MLPLADHDLINNQQYIGGRDLIEDWLRYQLSMQLLTLKVQFVYINNLHMNSKQQDYYDFYVDCSNPLSLIMVKKIQAIQQLKQKIPNNIFPNFIFLHRPTQANIHKSSLMAMLAQSTTPSFSVPLFCQLARDCLSSYHLASIDLFQNKYSELDFEAALQVILSEYTDETFFYAFINKLLRSGTNCLELFYGQYFVKLLSQAIKKAHRQDDTLKQFICYRGATISPQQLQQLQENIGFLSTSLSKSIAQTFIGNTLIEISVKDCPRHQQLDSKYAIIGAESQYIRQQQVLFNALSSFKIIDVVLAGNVWNIRLEYGCVSEVLYKYENGLDLLPDQIDLIPLILHQRQQFPNANLGQSIALTHDKNLKKQAISYLKQILSLYQGLPNYRSNIVYDYFQNQLYSCLTAVAKQDDDIKFMQNFCSRLLEQIQQPCQSAEQLVVRFQKIESIVKKYLIDRQGSYIQSLIQAAKRIVSKIPNYTVDKQNVDNWIKQKKVSIQIWQLHQELIQTTDFLKQIVVKKISNLKENIKNSYGQHHPLYKQILFLYWKSVTDFQYPSIIKRGGSESWQFEKIQRAAVSEDFSMLFYYDFYSFVFNVGKFIEEKEYDKAVKLSINFFKSQAMQKVDTPSSMTQICGPIFTLIDRLLEQLSLESVDLVIKCIKQVQKQKPQIFQSHVQQILIKKIDNLAYHKNYASDILFKQLQTYLENLIGKQSFMMEAFAASFLKTVQKLLGKNSPHFIIGECLKINGLRMVGRYEDANQQLVQLINKASNQNISPNLMDCILSLLQDDPILRTAPTFH